MKYSLGLNREKILHRCYNSSCNAMILKTGYEMLISLECWEDADGRLFIQIDGANTGVQVNYCPLCGYKAKGEDDK